MLVNQRSLYSHVLCDECKDKSYKHCCVDCKRKHLNARNAVYYKNKKSAENKAINSTSNGAVSGIDKSDSCVVKKKESDQSMHIYIVLIAKKNLKTKFAWSV